MIFSDSLVFTMTLKSIHPILQALFCLKLTSTPVKRGFANKVFLPFIVFCVSARMILTKNRRKNGYDVKHFQPT